VFDLATGEAQGADEGSVRTYPVKVDEGVIYIAPDVLMQMAAE
jgi:nitrite reductase (NADH) small subunit